MTILGLTIIAGALIGIESASVAADAPAVVICDLNEIHTRGELRSVLNHRSVEIVMLATSHQAETDAKLQKLISPKARFSIGSGDVGRTLGIGVAGARALSLEIKADNFRYFIYDYIPMQINGGCGTEKIEVEFTDNTKKYVYPLMFTYLEGRLIDVSGWTRSFESGPLEPIHK